MRKLAALITSALLVAVAFAGTAGASVHSHATRPPSSASTVKPLADYGPYNICDINEPSLCWTSNGIGNQISIETAGYAGITLQSDGSSGGEAVYTLANASGNCAYENGSHQINVVTGCDSSQTHEQFVLYNNYEGATGYEFLNMAEVDDAYVKGNQSNRDVWGGFGADAYWLLCPVNGISCTT